MEHIRSRALVVVVVATAALTAVTVAAAVVVVVVVEAIPTDVSSFCRCVCDKNEHTF